MDVNANFVCTDSSHGDENGSSNAAKKRRMIDGKMGGLQLMAKKKKEGAVQFGRGVRV